MLLFSGLLILVIGGLGYLVMRFYRKLGEALDENIELKDVIADQENDLEISSRPSSSADDLLKRMRDDGHKE